MLNPQLEKTVESNIDQESHIHSESQLPEVIPFPVITSSATSPENLNILHQLPEVEKTQAEQARIESLAEQINQLPVEEFNEMREKEIDRLNMYFDAFEDLFGLDLRSVSRTRTQMTKTIMLSTALFLESMFGENFTQEKAAIFFQSRAQAGGFQFNANGITRFAELGELSVIFSVLKRTVTDNEGDFEVDYPAFSFSPEIISSLKAYQNSIAENSDINSSDLYQKMSKIISLRIHDWIHAAFLYDTDSLTRIFSKWSKDSFFVKHIFDDPGRINYELISNRIHFAVWQYIYSNNPEAKTEVINDLKQVFLEVDKFINSADSEDIVQEYEKVGKFLLYLSFRGVVDTIPYTDQELLSSMQTVPRFTEVVNMMPVGTKDFLDGIYRVEEEVPFRQGSDETLPITQILQEYHHALLEEVEEYRQRQLETELLQGRYSNFKERLESLPEPILSQLTNIELTHHPRIIYDLHQLIDDLRIDHSLEIADFLTHRIEIDSQGFFYLKINQHEIDFSNATEVYQQKYALVVQVPWDSENAVSTQVRRTITATTTQLQALSTANPGDVILINTSNRTLADRLLTTHLLENGEINTSALISELLSLSEKGLVAVSDMYPVQPEKANVTFGLGTKDAVHTDENGRLVIRPGYYQTNRNLRHALNAAGPISMNANRDEEMQRRKILNGGIVSSNSEDIFPVHQSALKRFYGVRNTELKPVNFSAQAFLDQTVLLEQLTNVNQALSVTLSRLESMNLKHAHGFRGKPEPTGYKGILQTFSEEGVDRTLQEPLGQGVL